MSPRAPTLPPTLLEPTPLVTVYADGACHPNPGRGGWGAVLRLGPHERRLSGPVPEGTTTNQRAEIYAAIQALRALMLPCRVRLFSDSQYLIRTMNGDYRRRSNLDLWELLDAAAEPHSVAWEWCRGHAGDPDNESAHRLATSEVESAASAREGICEPRCYDGVWYYCGRLLSRRNVESREERCPGGTFICGDCIEGFKEFLKRAYDARAREKEWEV